MLLFISSAERGGEFLLLAQMPEPQPAWTQQYNRHMHPVWDRGFEPPAITGLESQDVLETLLLLYRKTGKNKYLKPVPPAIEYLRKSQLPDGKLARFYELKSNKPLYFTKDYQLTYSSKDDMPTHYGFIVESRLDKIEKEYRRLIQAKSKKDYSVDVSQNELTNQIRNIINSIDERGAWIENGWINSKTFVKNIRTLCKFLTNQK